MAQRKSRRIAEKSVGFGKLVRDDPMLEIASYGDNPMYWNKDTRDRYSCAPTDVSYRVLGQPDSHCPIEARIPELNLGPDGAPSLCCTSRQGPTSHEESLWFLRALKTIDQGAGQAWIHDTPPNLRRILDWINSPRNVSDIGNVNPAALLVVHSNREKYLDILKFAMMSSSATPVVVRLPNSASNEVVCQSLAAWRVHLGMRESTILYDDVVRVVNEVGVGIHECRLEATTPFVHQRVRVDPIHTEILRIDNDHNRSRCVDVADITNHFRTGNARRWRNQKQCVAEAFAVVSSATTIQAEMVSLFEAMKELDSLTFHWSHPVHVLFHLHTGHSLPAGYTGVRFQPGDIHTIGQAMADTQPNPLNLNFGEDPGVNEDFSFWYRHGPSFWIEVELVWDVVLDTLRLGLSKIN